MKEIKVNEYVRLARNQGINKIIDIYDKKYELETDIANEWGEFTCILEEYQLKDEIINHSKHLIDLIENKDVLKVRIDKTIMFFGIDEDTSDIKYKELIENIENGEYELLEILTHEQFEANCYKVGEDE
jgi:hypothetical protein|nr:MAG TPA: hypothetical protein [Caudoviricetes sp.]